MVEEQVRVAESFEEMDALVDEVVASRNDFCQELGLRPEMVAICLKAMIEARAHSVTFKDGRPLVSWDDLIGDAFERCLFTEVLVAASKCAAFLFSDTDITLGQAQEAAHRVQQCGAQIIALYEERKRAIEIVQMMAPPEEQSE